MEVGAEWKQPRLEPENYMSIAAATSCKWKQKTFTLDNELAYTPILR